MRHPRLAPTLVSLSLGLALAGAAWAQNPPAAAPTASPFGDLGGPVTAGVCLLSQDGLLSRSRIGQAATARLRELTLKVQAGLDAEKARLEARSRALEARRATLSPVELQTEGKALNARAVALQGQAADRNRQIDATRIKVYARLIDEARPLVAKAYATHACGLLLAREAALGGNFGNDLTPEVLTALDAQGAPLTFELEPLSH